MQKKLKLIDTVIHQESAYITKKARQFSRLGYYVSIDLKVETTKRTHGVMNTIVWNILKVYKLVKEYDADEE